MSQREGSTRRPGEWLALRIDYFSLNQILICNRGKFAIEANEVFA
ncbi:hypothetical protein RSSM_00719 [Rhodopirellula sallentina SM41]|uniref:Uncharacterized protein n=1 Tax=Rhodopirellula sallentina SM41 TaxID=1263870 RepID=M5UJ37_9BACT|nr:hypothetical protein RSSM_00719 [Rhodopirellula sallentina SM41]